MASEEPTECSTLSGKTIKTLNIFRATTNGTEIQIDFTDGTSFNCLVSNRTEIEASLSECGAGDPFAVQSIYHDDKFTYIKTTASEKFSVYEMKDGKPDLINYDLRDGTYIIPKIVDKGYIEIGKKHMDFSRKG